MTRLVVALAVLLSPLVAAADSFYWGGNFGRVSIQEGFHSSQGVGGWDLVEVQAFLRWSGQIDAMLPPGGFVKIVNHHETALIVIKQPGKPVARVQTDLAEVYGNFDAALAIIASALAKVPPKARNHPVYTVQLAGFWSPEKAQLEAQRLREANVRAPGTMYWSTCAPCQAQEPKVMETNRTGQMIYRVVSGVFASKTRAQAAADALAKQLGRATLVRAL